MATTTTTGFQPPAIPPAVLTPEPLALVPRGAASEAELYRVSIETARQYPRNEKAILARLKATLDEHPQYAEKLLYGITYYKGKPNEFKVEGLSIRAAETLRAEWGHMRVRALVVAEDENGFDLEVQAGDMEKNIWESTQGRSLKWLKRQKGQMELLDENRQIMARSAVQSKLRRNAILGLLPLHVKAAFEEWVREKMAGGALHEPAAPERVQRACDNFQKTLGVTPLQLEVYVGKPQTQWVGEDIAELRAIFNAIEAGEAAVTDVFDMNDKPVETVLTAPTVLEAKDGQLAPEAPPAKPPGVPGLGDAPPRPKPSATAATPPATPPPPPATAKTPRPPRVVPQPVEMPAPQPIPPAGMVEVDETAWRLQVSVDVREATTMEGLNAILSRIYTDPTVSKEAKRDAYTLISQRRDEIQRGG